MKTHHIVYAVSNEHALIFFENLRDARQYVKENGGNYKIEATAVYHYEA